MERKEDERSLSRGSSVLLDTNAARRNSSKFKSTRSEDHRGTTYNGK